MIPACLLLIGCARTDLPDGACALSEVPATPAEEAAVTERVPASLTLQVRWAFAPVATDESGLVVALTRGAGEATRAERGFTPAEACAAGAFVRVPYDAVVQVGDGDAEASGTVVLQADDATPPTLSVLSGLMPAFDGPRLSTTLSPDWQAAADEAAEPDWTAWTHHLSLVGPLGELAVEIGTVYASPDGDGVLAQWRGEEAGP